MQNQTTGEANARHCKDSIPKQAPEVRDKLSGSTASQPLCSWGVRTRRMRGCRFNNYKRENPKDRPRCEGLAQLPHKYNPRANFNRGDGLEVRLRTLFKLRRGLGRKNNN